MYIFTWVRVFFSVRLSSPKKETGSWERGEGGSLQTLKLGKAPNLSSSDVLCSAVQEKAFLPALHAPGLSLPGFFFSRPVFPFPFSVLLCRFLFVSFSVALSRNLVSLNSGVLELWCPRTRLVAPVLSVSFAKPENRNHFSVTLLFRKASGSRN